MALDLTGGRYVFFRSMQNSKNPAIRSAYKNAQNEINSITSVLSHMDSQYDSETDKELFNIRSYIDFVDDMAAVEQTAAEDFFKQQIQLLRQNHENELADKLEQYMVGSKEDPLQFIRGINELLQGSKVFEHNIKQNLERMRSITANMEAFDKNTRNQLTALFEESYDKYRMEFMKSLYSLDKSQRNYKFYAFKNINTMLAETINRVLKTITKDPNFLQNFYNAFNATQEISDADFKSIVVNTVAENVLSQHAIKISDQLVSDIQDSLQNMIDDIDQRQATLDEDYAKLASTKKFQTLEQEALKNNSDLAAIITQLDDKSIEKIKKKYPNTSQLIDNLLEIVKKKEEGEAATGIRKAKSELNTTLKASIKERINNELKDMKKNISPKQLAGELKKISGFLTPISLGQKISLQIGKTSFSHDAIAEAMNTTEVQHKIEGVLGSYTGAKEIKLKIDVGCSIGYVNSGGNSQFIDENEIKDIVDNTISTYFRDFMSGYNKKGHGATDINAAIEAYNEMLGKMKTHIDELIKDGNLPDESRQELYDAMYKTFSASFSVKDYELYNNELGAHGGNLGPGKIAEGVINNITKLYELGGITTIDAEKVLFATLNCGSDMIGSNIKQHIETYLLGGAALMMFDDCFANTKKFLEDAKKQFNGFQGQQVVHFYRVQDMYTPASFILKEISSNLKKMYEDLEQGVSFENIKQNNRVTISNPITENDIPSGGTRQSRFDAVSKKAQSNVKISFSFMGGLLDVFENFGKAFEQQ